jgi:hypothetical protein
MRRCRPPRGRPWALLARRLGHAPAPLPAPSPSLALASTVGSSPRGSTFSARSPPRPRISLPRSAAGRPPPSNCSHDQLRPVLLSSERAPTLHLRPVVRHPFARPAATPFRPPRAHSAVPAFSPRLTARAPPRDVGHPHRISVRPFVDFRTAGAAR